MQNYNYFISCAKKYFKTQQFSSHMIMISINPEFIDIIINKLSGLSLIYPEFIKGMVNKIIYLYKLTYSCYFELNCTWMVKTFRHFYILVDDSNIRSMSSGDVFVK